MHQQEAVQAQQQAAIQQQQRQPLPLPPSPLALDLAGRPIETLSGKNPLLQEATFGALYTLSKEKFSEGWRYVLTTAVRASASAARQVLPLATALFGSTWQSAHLLHSSLLLAPCRSWTSFSWLCSSSATSEWGWLPAANCPAWLAVPALPLRPLRVPTDAPAALPCHPWRVQLPLDHELHCLVLEVAELDLLHQP